MSEIGSNKVESRSETKNIGFSLSSRCIALLCCAFPPRRSSRRKIPRIGIVRGDRNAPAPSIKIFQQALQDLGYVEGKNIQFEYRYTEGSKDHAARIVAELVNLKVDIFSDAGDRSSGGQASDQDNSHCHGDYSGSGPAGLVDSLARPGGNITGTNSLTRNLSGNGWNY